RDNGRVAQARCARATTAEAAPDPLHAGRKPGFDHYTRAVKIAPLAPGYVRRFRKRGEYRGEPAAAGAGRFGGASPLYRDRGAPGLPLYRADWGAGRSTSRGLTGRAAPHSAEAPPQPSAGGDLRR